jgi:hypothetical protein
MRSLLKLRDLTPTGILDVVHADLPARSLVSQNSPLGIPQLACVRQRGQDYFGTLSVKSSHGVGGLSRRHSVPLDYAVQPLVERQPAHFPAVSGGRPPPSSEKTSKCRGTTRREANRIPRQQNPPTAEFASLTDQATCPPVTANRMVFGAVIFLWSLPGPPPPSDASRVKGDSGAKHPSRG